MSTLRFPVHRAALWAVALGLCAVAADRPAPAGADTHSTTVTSHHGDGYAYGSVADDDAQGGKHESFQYALVEPGEHASLSVSDGDQWPAVLRAQREAKRLDRRVFWFRLEGRPYLVTDPDLVARAAKTLQPIQELGARQGMLGAEQGRWGAMQGQLGALEGRIGALQARVALASAIDRDDRSDADKADLADLKREVEDLRVQARDLGEQQRALGEKQRALGRRQGELGRQQKTEWRSAFADLRALAKEALASGRAQSFGD
jgi:hypothetical protein